ncbi:MAG: hypothetical protein QOH83_557 [Solirubrobacteraceae bacterium]|nr:hypothetical protein [Solirubrobacteraceae bacterium]
MGSVANAAPTPTRRRVALRRHLATTPGRLRLAAALLALSAIVFGAVAARAAGERRDAVTSVGATESLLVSAVKLSASLSNTHAIAAFSFLRGKPELAQSRRLYDDEMQRASVGVATLAREIGTPSGSGPVRRITQTLPVYAGLVENARANNRQGFPVGSAYLRKASKTMRNGMLPAARDLYKIAAQNLTTSYRAGVSSAAILAVVLAGCTMVMLLAQTQIYLARRTRRILNPGLVVATALLLGLLVWIVVAFTMQQSALAEAHAKGSDPVELLTTTRILASRAQADESIALAARGGGEEEPRLHDVDRGFQAVTRPITGLLEQAHAIAGDASAAIDAVDGAYRTYLAAHSRVVEQVQDGDFTKAVQLAVDRGTDGSPSTKQAGDALDEALVREVGIAQGRFDDAAARADSALDGLAVGIPALTVLCALLALFGVRQRLEEYR